MIEYILNPKSCGIATGLNIVADVDGAYEMFRQLSEVNANERFYKNEITEGKNSIRLHHYIQSFDPKQPITPEEAHKIGVEWAKKVFGNSRQVIVSTHIEKAHIHNHFAVAAFDFSGKRWHDNKHPKQLFADTAASKLITLSSSDKLNFVFTSVRKIRSVSITIRR
jgi:type IV secretory pathway VirD2 relaxase